MAQDPRIPRQSIVYLSFGVFRYALFVLLCPPDYRSMCFGGGEIYDDRVPLLFSLKSNIYAAVMSLYLY